MGRHRKPTGERLCDRANDRLEEAKVPVRILNRDGRLKLQATLPKKPGEGAGKKQRQLALNLPATPDGYREAEHKAHELGRSLLFGTFRWADWEPDTQGQTVREWVERLKEQHFRESDLSDRTWKLHWEAIYKELPQDAELTAAMLLAQVLTVPTEQAWKRRQVCLKLQKLADIAGIEVNLRKYQGSYGKHSQKEIEVPTDAAIAQFWAGMKSAPWRWVYGIMATFGVRDHEVCFCHFERDADGQIILAVEEGKTGPRLVYPFYPAWVEEFALEDIVRPKLTFRPTSKYKDAGDRIHKGLKRNQIPWNPYALRHAYAIRESVIFGLPVAEAAQNMGHDPSVHLSTYNRWINQSHRRQIFQQKKDAVKPPTLS